jgi:hypothetical protein
VNSLTHHLTSVAPSVGGSVCQVTTSSIEQVCAKKPFSQAKLPPPFCAMTLFYLKQLKILSHFIQILEKSALIFKRK